MFEHCQGVLWLARLLTGMMNWESWWKGTHQVTITIYKRKQQYFKTDIEKGYYYWRKTEAISIYQDGIFWSELYFGALQFSLTRTTIKTPWSTMHIFAKQDIWVCLTTLIWPFKEFEINQIFAFQTKQFENSPICFHQCLKLRRIMWT